MKKGNILYAALTALCLVLGIVSYVVTSSRITYWQAEYDTADYMGLQANMESMRTLERKGISILDAPDDAFDGEKGWVEYEEECEDKLAVWKPVRIISICVFSAAFVFFGIIAIKKQ